MTLEKMLFHGKDWIHVDTSADSVNIDGKTYYPFAENPSGQYKINGTSGVNFMGIEIDFTISKDGKLTVGLAEVGTEDITDIKVTKQPL